MARAPLSGESDVTDPVRNWDDQILSCLGIPGGAEPLFLGILVWAMCPAWQAWPRCYLGCPITSVTPRAGGHTSTPAG